MREGLCLRIVPRALLSASGPLESPSAVSHSLLFSRFGTTTGILEAVLVGATLRMDPVTESLFL